MKSPTISETTVSKSPEEVVRACFTAYEKKDRRAIESLLAEDFTFTSPLDDAISRERYLERCWPNSEHLDAFKIENLMVKGDKVFVQYEAGASNQPPFRNTELFTIRDGKMVSVEVYFGSEEPAAGAADEEAIRHMIGEWAESIRRKDAAMSVSWVQKDAVRFDLAPPLRNSQPVRENLEEWFATFQGGIGYAINDLQVVVSGDTAWSHSLHHLTGTKTDGAEVDLWFRATLCLQRTDGKWQVAHIHESVPFLMDGSKKAALNLKP